METAGGRKSMRWESYWKENTLLNKDYIYLGTYEEEPPETMIRRMIDWIPRGAAEGNPEQVRRDIRSSEVREWCNVLVFKKAKSWVR